MWAVPRYRRPNPLLSRLRSLVLLGLGAVAVLATFAALGFRGSDAPVVPSSAKVTTAAAGRATISGSWKVTPVVAASPTSVTVADATGPTVDLFSSPGVPYGEKPQLANPTFEGLPVVFLVLDEQPDWLQVRVSSRPNNLVLWIQRSQVALRTVPNRVVVELGAHRVTVFHGDTVLLQETVAVGTARTPTPLGSFFVDGIVPLTGNGPYGAGQVSVSGFSEVLHSFGGGVGQIAMHGTNRPDLLGQNVSNGCIRMGNDTVTRIMQLAPLGTPVTVVA